MAVNFFLANGTGLTVDVFDHGKIVFDDTHFFNLVENTVSKFLPVYLVWIIIVVFGFPLLFGIN